jgi:hypothetical protein
MNLLDAFLYFLDKNAYVMQDAFLKSDLIRLLLDIVNFGGGHSYIGYKYILGGMATFGICTCYMLAMLLPIEYYRRKPRFILDNKFLKPITGLVFMACVPVMLIQLLLPNV